MCGSTPSCVPPAAAQVLCRGFPPLCSRGRKTSSARGKVWLPLSGLSATNCDLPSSRQSRRGRNDIFESGRSWQKKLWFRPGTVAPVADISRKIKQKSQKNKNRRLETAKLGRLIWRCQPKLLTLQSKTVAGRRFPLSKADNPALSGKIPHTTFFNQFFPDLKPILPLTLCCNARFICSNPPPDLTHNLTILMMIKY